MISVQSEYALDATALSEQWQQQAWVKFNSDNVVTPVKNGEDEEVNLLQISQLLNKNENALQFWTVADEQRFSLAFLAVELLKEVITSY